MASNWTKVLEANSTTNTAPTVAETATKPTAGVIALQDEDRGNKAPSNGLLELLPFGTDAADETFSMYVIGWNKNAAGTLWIGRVLHAVTCTLSTVAGIEAGIGTSAYYCDTIAAVSGYPAPLRNGSNGANQPASIIVDPAGAELVQIAFNRGSSAAAANAHWRHANYLGARQ